MVVCNFFLQGRCRYGEKCWNEHPRGGSRGGGGGGGGYNDSYSRSRGQQQQPRGGGGGGFGNRVWVNPSQQRGGYIQPSSFSSQGSSDWGSGREGGGGGGGGRRENLKSSDFSFSAPNRFSALNAPSAFDRGERGGTAGGGTTGDEDDDKKLEVIQTDMDVWESSGQWGFSCYSYFKTPISGFTDLSPEELRLEYYSTRASGDLQGYLNGVNQLLSQWKSRVQELKIMNPSTRLALLAELNGTAPHSSSSGFGSTSSFGSKGFDAPAPAQANSFGFPAPSSGFGSSSASSPLTGFGSLITAPTQPPSGFGSSSTPSASSFSFAPPSADKPPASSGFGSASGFSFSSAAPSAGGGFGSSFGASSSSSAFGAASASPAAAGGVVGEATDGLFSSESRLTQEELNQFKAKRFTLGQIPLKPPPASMLVV